MSCMPHSPHVHFRFSPRAGAALIILIGGLVLSACSNAASPTFVTQPPIQSAVVGDATRRAGLSGTSTLNAQNNNPQQLDAAAMAGPAAPTLVNGTASAGGNAGSNAGGTGQAQPTPAPAEAVDPCTLMTAADIQQVLGTAVQPAARTTGADGSQVCQYVGTSAAPTTITLTVYQGTAQVATAQRALSSGTAVPGVGDAAAQSGNILYVRAGARYVALAVTVASTPGQSGPGGPPATAASDTAVALARIITPRLAGVAPTVPATAISTVNPNGPG